LAPVWSQSEKFGGGRAMLPPTSLKNVLCQERKLQIFNFEVSKFWCQFGVKIWTK